MDIETIEKLLGKPDAYVVDVKGWKNQKEKPGVVEAIREAFPSKSSVCDCQLVALRRKNVYDILSEDVSDFVSDVSKKLTENDGFTRTSSYNLENLILNAIECSFNEKDGSSVYEKSCHLRLRSPLVFELWEMGECE